MILIFRQFWHDHECFKCLYLQRDMVEVWAGTGSSRTRKMWHGALPIPDQWLQPLNLLYALWVDAVWETFRQSLNTSTINLVPIETVWNSDPWSYHVTGISKIHKSTKVWKEQNYHVHYIYDTYTVVGIAFQYNCMFHAFSFGRFKFITLFNPPLISKTEIETVCVVDYW